MRCVVFCGGSGSSNIISSEDVMIFEEVMFLVPVSDDGGSSGSLSSSLGIPAVGDMRARICRLAQPSQRLELYRKRLCIDAALAKLEFDNFLQSLPESETFLMARLAHFISLVSELSFSFANGSIGNFAIASLYFEHKSLSKASEMICRELGIPPSVTVCSLIDFCPHPLRVAVELDNGDVIRGQNEVSHPSTQIQVDKSFQEPLPSPIKALHVGCDGASPNMAALTKIANAALVLYSCGSLFTSIIAQLVLPQVGSAISKSNAIKVLLLNNQPVWPLRNVSQPDRTERRLASQQPTLSCQWLG